MNKNVEIPHGLALSTNIDLNLALSGGEQTFGMWPKMGWDGTAQGGSLVDEGKMNIGLVLVG